jgi:hypothetical protein
MEGEKVMKKILVAFSVSVAVALSASGAYALAIPPFQEEKILEAPMELSADEYSADAEKFYSSHADLVVMVDLVNPQGIEAALLPSDIKSLIKPGFRVLAYRETARINLNGGKPNGFAMPCAFPEAGISCATYSASRDMTISSVFGSVEQFSRVIAPRYDWYPRCQGGVNCFGWEIEKQYMWWKRSVSTWNVKNGLMKTYIEAEDYCTQYSTILNYGSTTIQPAWSGNQTLTYSISGFPNNAYVPWPSGYSYTQGDIYQGTTLKYNDARSYQFWPRY